MKINKAFSQAANVVATATGRPAAFMLCVATVIVWGITGPLFKFSDTWQLVINTGTTIITFLMVFLIQNTANRETSAMQVKLDEIIYSIRGAQNRMIGIEHLTDTELEELIREAEARAAIPPHKRTAKSFGEMEERPGKIPSRPPVSKPAKRKPATARRK